MNHTKNLLSMNSISFRNNPNPSKQNVSQFFNLSDGENIRNASRSFGKLMARHRSKSGNPI